MSILRFRGDGLPRRSRLFKSLEYNRHNTHYAFQGPAMSDNGETRKKITAFDLATIIAGWSTALALALGFITFTITYRAQEKFNQAQLKFNEQQQKFNDAQLDATNKQASFLAETAAIEAFRAYFAAGIEAAKPADRNQWLTNDAFFTAETI